MSISLDTLPPALLTLVEVELTMSDDLKGVTDFDRDWRDTVQGGNAAPAVNQALWKTAERLLVANRALTLTLHRQKKPATSMTPSTPRK